MTEKNPDEIIDDIIWAEIGTGGSKGDFICYAVHTPVGAKHLAKAQKEIEKDGSDISPLKYPDAIKKIEALAEKENPAAVFHMGKVHALGIACARDLEKAVFWYEKAMALGEPRAYANLGWFYQAGQGVPFNPEKAFELLSYAGEHGVLSAKASAGMMLLRGEVTGIPDREAGIKKLEEAFYAGYLNAGNHLSDLYFEGRLVEKDIPAGHGWLEMTARAGDARSAAILGHHLITGSCGITDKDAGLDWIMKAVDNGYGPAFLWLGSLYRKGNGLPQDTAKALDLFRRGIKAGSRDCEKALSMLLAEMSLAGDGKPGALQ